MSQPLPETQNPETQPANTPPPAPPAAPASPQPASPAPAPPASPEPARRRIGDAQDAAFQNIYDAISALPEKIVDAVREVTPPAPVVNKPEETQGTKRRSFADWWFGK